MTIKSRATAPILKARPVEAVDPGLQPPRTFGAWLRERRKLCDAMAAAAEKDQRPEAVAERLRVFNLMRGAFG